MFIRHSASPEEDLLFESDQASQAMLRRRLPAFHHFELLLPPSRDGNRRPSKPVLETLEQVRRRYGFVVVGYVVMPEHFHLLISEPETGTPSTVIQVLKQRFSRQLLKSLQGRGHPAQGELWDEMLAEGHVWQRRFYDFVVWSYAKRLEKLRYIHRNPVKRGLVLQPEQWPWSSFRHYAYDEAGPVLVNEQQPSKMKVRSPQSMDAAPSPILP